MTIMKKHIFSWVIPSIIAACFYWYVATYPNYFNFLPYQLHELIFQGDHNELVFILIFDFFIALMLFWIFRKLLKRIR